MFKSQIRHDLVCSPYFVITKIYITFKISYICSYVLYISIEHLLSQFCMAFKVNGLITKYFI